MRVYVRKNQYLLFNLKMFIKIFSSLVVKTHLKPCGYCISADY